MELSKNELSNEKLSKKSYKQLQQLLKFKIKHISKTCRSRLNYQDSYEDLLKLLNISTKILVVSGAGISVNLGIPDFRSKGGLYDQINQAGYKELDEPQQLFDLDTFVKHPQLFYSITKSILPSLFEPGPAHLFIKVRFFILTFLL